MLPTQRAQIMLARLATSFPLKQLLLLTCAIRRGIIVSYKYFALLHQVAQGIQ